MEKEEAFTGLSRKAQKQISACFEEQGLLYDPMEELERAYAMYCSRTDEDFSFHRITQSVEAVSASRRIICFKTVVHQPILGDSYDGRLYWDMEVPVIFDRRTGKEIPFFDLFTVPEEEAWQRLTGSLTGRDPEAMSQALRPEYINLLSRKQGIQVKFPPGTLPGFSDGTRHAFIRYEDLEDIMKSWAIPDKVY